MAIDQNYVGKNPLADLASRITSSMRAGYNTFFANNAAGLQPGEPPEPSEPRNPVKWKYPYGFNMQYTPRGTEPIGFQDLRDFADLYDVLRIVIEKRKRTMQSLDWDIIPIQEGKNTEFEKEAKATKDFLKFPDKTSSWTQWLNMIMEDRLVIDALTIYPRKTLNGSLYSLEVIDGATIKPVIDNKGYIPVPPEPAFLQVINGDIQSSLTREDILYLPQNRRVNKVYGFSPVEYILLTVKIALNRQVFNLNYYTDGNIPSAIFMMAKDITKEQMEYFQQYFDADLAGNLKKRNKVKMVQGVDEIKELSKFDNKTEFDAWLARVVCAAFDISPEAFDRLINRATAEVAASESNSAGFDSDKSWIEETMTMIIQHPKLMNKPNLKFSFIPKSREITAIEVQQEGMYIDKGVLSVDEVREKHGLKPLGIPRYVTSNITFLKDFLPHIGVKEQEMFYSDDPGIDVTQETIEQQIPTGIFGAEGLDGDMKKYQTEEQEIGKFFKWMKGGVKKRSFVFESVSEEIKQQLENMIGLSGDQLKKAKATFNRKRIQEVITRMRNGSTSRMKKEFKKYFSKVGERALDNLGKGHKDADFLMPENDDTIDEILKKFYTEGIKRSYTIVKRNLKKIDDETFKKIEPKIGKLIKKNGKLIRETLRSEIANQIKIATKEGLSTKQLASGGEFEIFNDAGEVEKTVQLKGIQGVFKEQDDYGAERIARTESMRAYDQGSLLSYEEAGIQFMDVIGCEDDEIMPGQKYGCNSVNIPIDEAFDIEFHPNHSGLLLASLGEI